ncbi:hypothetical protein H1V43_32450 [Streptomyces sp. PSKA54]|uniref:Uncharacterized protein n=1 Tax=Streptomyces himalayensis subsp. aureolus TaxID=2758039 RepID=A0A7W2D7N6_9ACTN|nr:hypothetical protein [Streptomyces himalayensis]MBA4865975.1 hypothetical protein [Streptomyces himalayensis subsp. aureolus]
MSESTKPQLSFTTDSTWFHGRLRVDQIRTDTLVQLVAGWGDDDTRDDVIATLDKLAAVVNSPRREGELDAAIEEVEGVAAMDTAQVEVDVRDGRRLGRELAVVVGRLGRFNPVRRAS